jgi:hypothetical protein
MTHVCVLRRAGVRVHVRTCACVRKLISEVFTNVRKIRTDACANVSVQRGIRKTHQIGELPKKDHQVEKHLT